MRDSSRSEKEPIEETQELRAGKAKFEEIGHGISKRKGPNDELDRAPTEWKKTFDATKDSIMLLDAEFKILQANLATSELLGKPLDEIVGKKCWQVVHDADKPPEKCTLRTARQTKKREETELYMPVKDIWVGVTVDPILDEKGSLTSAVHIIRDITERRKAEEELAKGEEKYRSLVANIPDVVWTSDDKGNTVFISSNVEKIYGYTEQEIYEQDEKLWFGRIHPDDVDMVKRVFSDVFEKGKQLDVEYRIKRKDGQWIWLQDRSIGAYEKDGVKYADGVFFDITERKKAEETLHLYGEIITNMSEGVYAIRAGDGVVFYTNPKFEEMFGYGPGELIGKHVSVVNAPCEKTPEETAAEIMKILNKQGSWQGEICNLKKDGVPFWCYASVSTFEHPEHGKVLVSTHTDITEHKKAERELLEYQAKLKSLASELSLAEERERRRIADGIHDDIGTKLAVAKFELQSLMKGPAETAIAASLESVCAEIDKVIEDAHSLTFELSNPVLYEVGLDAAVESWLGQHIGKESRLRYEVASEPSPMKPDVEISVVLFGVIRELLSNVIMHADASLVQVHIQKDGETIRVSIEDDGVGFELSKADLPVKETGGFGLFHVRERIEYLSGKIEIESKPGRGTCIRISVPVQQSTSR